jgi:hypothetical protein
VAFQSIIGKRKETAAEGSFRLGSSRTPPYLFSIKAKITYWPESDGKYLGYLNDYPDHWTQGEDLDDLKKHLRDLVTALERAGC